jgi:DNA-binding beta-propeller fold protein YncE
MRARLILKSIVLTSGLLLAACGGGDSNSTTATASSAVDTTAFDTTVPATDAATTAPSTAPPTTLPPTLDLSTLPGLLAVIATSCAPEPYPPQNEVENPSVCTLNPDGTDVKVVSQPGESPVGLAFTRSGTHLWYGDPYTKFGYVINLTTGEHRERQRNETLRSGVSPDGQLMLFVEPYTYGFAIAKSDGSEFPDGSTSQTVVDDPYVSYWGGPTWAPDGVHFAYLSILDGNGGGDLECAEIWIGAIDGTPPVKITDFASKADGAEGCPNSVRWSPTDDRILVHMLGKPMFVAENLYVIDPDGSNLTALTHGVPHLDPNASTWAMAGSSYAGDWSPDGKFIVFIMGDGTDYQLAVMNADGSQVTTITAAPLGITSSLVSIRWSLG